MSSDNLIKESNSQNEISLKEVLIEVGVWYRYLVSKWLIIILFGLLGCILGFIYAYYQKPTYIATTTFVLEEDQASASGLGSIAGIASIAGFDLGGGGGGIFQGDNILQLYKSRKMIQKTLLTKVDFHGKDKLLIDHYIDFNKMRADWSTKNELKNIKFFNNKGFSRVQDSIIGVITSEIDKRYLNVAKVDKKLSIIKAEVSSKDEFFSKAFDEQIVKNVNDFYVQTKTKKSNKNIAILKHKADSVRAVMNGAIYSAVEITDATPNLNPTRQVQRVAPTQKAQFSAETNKAILGELVKNLELSKMALLKETPLIQVIDEPVFPLRKEKFGKAKGILVGGFLMTMGVIFYLILKRIYRLLFA